MENRRSLVYTSTVLSEKIMLTLSIIKPGAVARNNIGKINAMIESAGFKIVAQKMIAITKIAAEKFYEVHKNMPFYGDLCSYMSSGKIVVQVLEGGSDAVLKYREIMGATDPLKAADGTIRKLYGVSIDDNAVHGSDSDENAAKEIAFFFSGLELL